MTPELTPVVTDEMVERALVAWGNHYPNRQCVGWTIDSDRMRNVLYAVLPPSPDGSRVTTHWNECWRDLSHHACAVAKIEAAPQPTGADALRKIVERVRREWQASTVGDMHLGVTGVCADILRACEG